MNKRLLTIMSLIENGKGIIDVGTDHGYIPIALAQQGYCGKIFASDINRGPLDSAIKNAKESKMEDKIQFLLCDGLALCPYEEIDTIVIAGMGGDMICKILDYAEWTMDPAYKLILQPMTKQEILRYWLSNNGFETEREELAVEGDQIYQILSVRFGGETKYSDAELYVGKKTLNKDRETYVHLIKRTEKRFIKVIADMESSERTLTSQRKFYENILSELKEMGKNHDAC